MAEWGPVGLSAMHHRHVALGAVMVERGGWQRPATYTSADQEIERARLGVGLGDVSPIRKLGLQGTGLDVLLTQALPSLEPPPVGEVARQAGGGGGAEHVVARLAQDEALVLGLPREAIAEEPDLCAHVVEITSALAAVSVMGPSAQALLSGVTDLDVSSGSFPDLRCAQAAFAEIHGTLLRLDLGDLPAYHFYFSREFGEYMWEALMGAGQAYHVTPLGLEAMEQLQ